MHVRNHHGVLGVCVLQKKRFHSELIISELEDDDHSLQLYVRFTTYQINTSTLNCCMFLKSEYRVTYLNNVKGDCSKAEADNQADGESLESVKLGSARCSEE